MAGQHDQKKRPGDKQIPDRGAAQEQEQEEVGPELEAPETEQSRLQSQVGNQGVLAMLASGMEGMGGAGGIEVESVRRKKGAEKHGPAHGGDDDADPGPITVHDLTQSWNPGTKRKDDRPAFLEPMPDDELPPEDAAFIEQVRHCADPYPLPPLSSGTLDPLLQPSPEVIRIALTDWAQAARTFGAPGLAGHLLGQIVAPPAPALLDPHGRVLLARSRAATIATCLLLEAPVLRAAPTATTCAALGFALELAARHHQVRAVQIIARDLEGRELPMAAGILAQHLDDRPHGEVKPRQAPESATATLTGILNALADYEDPQTLIPDLADPGEAPDPDDPLGLDAVMEAMTGGAADPLEEVYDAAIQAAERVATAAARSRVVFAGCGVAVADVAGLWSAGAPTANLGDAMDAYDRDIAGTLQLLVEIARAAQRRSVPPEGLRVGLRRAARSLKRLRDRGTKQLTEVIWGILPGDPELLHAPPEVPEAVASAFAIGRPLDALPWLLSEPPSLERDTAALLVRVASGALPDELIDALRAIVTTWQAQGVSALTLALDIVRGACALYVGAHDEALGVADALLEHGRARRNGLLVAEGALLGMEVHLERGELLALHRRRERAGHLLWRMGARGALSLLARWHPPVPDEEADWS